MGQQERGLMRLHWMQVSLQSKSVTVSSLDLTLWCSCGRIPHSTMTCTHSDICVSIETSLCKKQQQQQQPRIVSTLSCNWSKPGMEVLLYCVRCQSQIHAHQSFLLCLRLWGGNPWAYWATVVDEYLMSTEMFIFFVGQESNPGWSAGYDSILCYGCMVLQCRHFCHLVFWKHSLATQRLGLSKRKWNMWRQTLNVLGTFPSLSPLCFWFILLVLLVA